MDIVGVMYIWWDVYYNMYVIDVGICYVKTKKS